MQWFCRYVVPIALAVGAVSGSVSQETAAVGPTTQPNTVVRGRITAESEVPLSEMVVYLESPDAQRILPPPGKPVRVSQKDAQFDPKIAVISVGQSIEFPNDENRPIEHNVFSNSTAKRFDLGLYGPGSGKSVSFDKPGPVFLYCSIHRYMDGVIFVSPTPFTSRVDPQGHFEIADVPPGQWIVRTWQRRRRFPEQSATIAIELGKPTECNLELKRK